MQHAAVEPLDRTVSITTPIRLVFSVESNQLNLESSLLSINPVHYADTIYLLIDTQNHCYMFYYSLHITVLCQLEDLMPVIWIADTVQHLILGLPSLSVYGTELTHDKQQVPGLANYKNPQVFKLWAFVFLFYFWDSLPSTAVGMWYWYRQWAGEAFLWPAISDGGSKVVPPVLGCIPGP